MEQTHEINLDRVFDFAHVGMNRAQYFSILCHEALRSLASLNEWIVPNSHPIIMTINPLSEDFEKTKDNFQAWVNRNLVREIVEGLYLTIDELHWYCLLLDEVKQHKGRLYLPRLPKLQLAQEKYRAKNLDDKLKALKKYKIIIDSKNNKKIFNGLRDVRNSLSHHGGRVTADTGQLASNGKRKIEWLTYDIHLRTESGKKRKIELKKPLNEPCRVVLQIKKHAKICAVGEHLLFSPKEVFEIVRTVERLVIELKEQLNKNVQESGLTLNIKDKAASK